MRQWLMTEKHDIQVYEKSSMIDFAVKVKNEEKFQ